MRRLARILVSGGAAVAVLGLGKLHAASVAGSPYDFTGSSRFAWSLGYAALLAVAAYGAGLPDLVRGLRAAVLASTAAVAAAAGAVSVAQLLLGTPVLPRFVVIGSAAALVPWMAGCAVVAAGGRLRAGERERVVVVADVGEGTTLLDDLERDPERPAKVVAVLPTADASVAEGAVGQPLVELAASRRATLVVLARSAQADETVVAQAASLHECGVRVRTLSLFYEQWLGKLPLGELERVSLMFDIGELHRARYGRLKRVLDVGIAFAVLPLVAAVLPVVVLGNLVGNRGPLLYRQRRVGRHGHVFTILKLRTMRPGATESGWTTLDDPRITTFGRVLRRTHLDELPQAWNILRGDLSVVGPRPEQPRYVEELAAKLPFYDVRHLVRPGLTGWAQVKYGYAGSEADALEKLQYEFFYLRHQRLSLDLRIVGRTLRSVLGRKGR